MTNKFWGDVFDHIKSRRKSSQIRDKLKNNYRTTDLKPVDVEHELKEKNKKKKQNYKT